MKRQSYAIVIEKGDRNYSAYAPDLPGCAAAGRTKREVVALLRQAIVLHLKGMVEDGEKIPKPSTTAGSVLVSMPARVRRGVAG